MADGDRASPPTGLQSAEAHHGLRRKKRGGFNLALPIPLYLTKAQTYLSEEDPAWAEGRVFARPDLGGRAEARFRGRFARE